MMQLRPNQSVAPLDRAIPLLGLVGDPAVELRDVVVRRHRGQDSHRSPEKKNLLDIFTHHRFRLSNMFGVGDALFVCLFVSCCITEQFAIDVFDN